jgi:hypothetical protein
MESDRGSRCKSCLTSGRHEGKLCRDWENASVTIKGLPAVVTDFLEDPGGCKLEPMTVRRVFESNGWRSATVTEVNRGHTLKPLPYRAMLTSHIFDESGKSGIKSWFPLLCFSLCPYGLRSKYLHTGLYGMWSAHYLHGWCSLGMHHPPT